MARNQLVTHKFLDYEELQHKPGLSSPPPPSPLKSKAIAQKKYEKHRSRTKQAGEKGSGNA